MRARRIWIDTDVGTNPDDTVALWCAARAPGAELVGVSTVDDAGGWRAAFARELVPGVEVYAGPPPPERLAGADVLAGIGPWTNVAGLASGGHLPGGVVLMGGALRPVHHRGRRRRVEHNVGRDPQAAAHLLARVAGLVVVPLDATAAVTVDADGERALTAAIPPLAAQLTQWRDRRGDFSLVLHDPAAVLVALGVPVARFGSRRLRIAPDGRMRRALRGPSQQVVVRLDADATRAHVGALAAGPVTKGD
jgi:inosine-uridine nucleoside N-ribohydrolase